MIKVSAIITTHNRLQLLKRAIDSVLKQSYANIELIVVDDHSTDGTVEWCQNNGINILRSPERGGNKARNFGILNSTGDYIAFLDDDDVWFPTKIAKQIELAETSGSGVIYCGLKKSIKLETGWKYEEIYPIPLNQGDVSLRILQEIFTVTSALMVSRKSLEEAGLFDERLGFWQEYELSIRLAQFTNFSAVNEILVDYLVDLADQNRLTNKYAEWKKSVRRIHRKHRSLYRKLSPLEKIAAKRVEIWDGVRRSSNAGLDMRRRYNLLQLKLSFIAERLFVILSKHK